MILIQKEPLFLKYTCWTDGLKFTNNVIINKYNYGYWSILIGQIIKPFNTCGERMFGEGFYVIN